MALTPAVAHQAAQLSPSSQGFKPNLCVKEGLDHLASRLNPIITQRLAGELNGLPWTAILQVLDEKKGYRENYQYSVNDLQAQLRMLTERLGTLGYPFDDRDRHVSTLGNELRIVRKQEAHTHTFSAEEAFRANDFCVRLLEHFGDGEALAEAKRIRREALVAWSAQEGISEQEAVARTPEVAPIAALSEGGPSAALEDEAEPETVIPDAAVLVRTPSLIGDQRLQFEPWTVVPVGDTQILDDLPKKAAKEKVRAAAVEIASFEGPIHVDRLVDLTAESFGLHRVHKRRHDQLVRQISQTDLIVDPDGFVWPPEIDPETWTEFRPNDSTVNRPFPQISPVEIANAARFIVNSQPDMSPDDLAVATLQTFGRRRQTKQISQHLQKALARLTD